MEKRTQSRESRKMRLGTAAMEERIVSLKEGLEEARVKAPERVKPLELDLDIAQKEKELFLWQHDTTGAWKGDRFGGDVRTQFEAMGGRGAEGGERTHLLLINMGELDRLNESGDHALGDKALEIAFARIQECIREHLQTTRPELADDEEALERSYDVYRTAGADFSVTLKDMSAEDATAIERSIVGPLDVSEEKADEEPTYLTSTRVSFEEAEKILEHVRPVDGDPEVDASMFVLMLKEKAMTLSDFERTRVRLERVIEKMSSSGTGLSAETVYEKYHKGALGPLFAEPGKPPLDYAEFVKAVTDLGAQEGSDEWRRKAFEVSRTSAIERFRSRNSQQRKFNERILEFALEDIESHAPEGVESADMGPESGTLRLMQEVAPEDVAAFEIKTAFLGETEGHEVLDRLEKEKDEADAVDGPDAEARRMQTLLAFEIENAKRDRLTGLAGRGVFFQRIERQLENGRPVSIMSVDMAFLKFFDKEGGQHTGDTAIQTAARILDYAARNIREKHGIGIEACRVGGDEFSFSVESADPKILKDVEDLIRDARSKAGPIPAHEGAFQTFQPEALQFNIGIQSVDSSKALKALLGREGIEAPADLTPVLETKWLADQMNHMADAKIGPMKAISRLTFLLSRGIEMQTVAEEDKPSRQLLLKTLMTYSEKAIFGDAGKRRIADWLPRLGSKSVRLGELIRSEIIPFVREQFKKKGTSDLRLSEEMEEALEYEIRLSLSEQRITELEDRLEEQTEQLGHAHETVQRLKKELVEERMERDAVSGLREQVKDAA